MTLTSIGDLAQSLMLRRQNSALKADLSTLSAEMTTGHAADIARRVNGDFAPLGAIDASLARLRAYDGATTEAALRAGAMQIALTTIDGLASDLAPTLLQPLASGQEAQVAILGADARQKFETVVSTLNAVVGDRTLFAGQATNRPALADSETILASIETAIAGAVSAADVEVAVSNWFDDPGGFASTAYLGADPLDGVPIAPNEVAAVTITAMDPALRDTMKGLAMAALLDRGALAGAPAARTDLARRAGQSLISGQTARTDLAAGLGMVEAQIEAATSRNAAESAALQIARAAMVEVDPYDSATRLEATQTQLETLYAITARLSRLNLMDFLR